MMNMTRNFKAQIEGMARQQRQRTRTGSSSGALGLGLPGDALDTNTEGGGGGGGGGDHSQRGRLGGSLVDDSDDGLGLPTSAAAALAGGDQLAEQQERGCRVLVWVVGWGMLVLLVVLLWL